MMRDRLNKLAARLPKWKRIHNRMMMSVSAQIADLIDKKFKTRKEFADSLGKNESELSKWLSGNHNFTLKSLAKIEAELGEQFIFMANELEDNLQIYKPNDDAQDTYRVFSHDTNKSAEITTDFNEDDFITLLIAYSSSNRNEWNLSYSEENKNTVQTENIFANTYVTTEGNLTGELT